MSEQEKKNDKESMICLTSKLRQSCFVYHILSKEKFITDKELFKEKGEWRIEKKPRKILTALAMVINVNKKICK